MLGYVHYNTGSDPVYHGVTAVLDADEPKTLGELMEGHRQGKYDDVFDVTLYGNPEGDEQERRWFDESYNALHALLTFANIGLKALTTINRLQDEAEVSRRRTLLYVAYRNEIGPGERWEDTEPYVKDDPYDLTPEGVNALWAEVGSDAVSAVYETGDYIRGEDYETLDQLDGEEAALSAIYQAITQVEQAAD